MQVSRVHDHEYTYYWYNFFQGKVFGDFIVPPISIYDVYNFIYIDIIMNPIISYHLLNTFFTSFLILLISYATYFFNVEDFNERIMVSLTALLVLTGLFTQSTTTTIYTPYLKITDVWYAVLITATFLNVVINTGLNAWHRKLTVNGSPHTEITKDTIRKKLVKVNRVFLIIMIVCFVVFLTGFILIVNSLK